MTGPSLPPLPERLGAVRSSTPMGGGGWEGSGLWRALLSDGRDVVIKAGPTDATSEAEGLDALRAAGAPTPEVLAVDERVLVLEHVSGTGDPAELGQTLAGVHAQTAPTFGWHRDNAIGPLAQRNTPTEDWPTFLAEHRIGPHLDVLPPPLATRLRAVMDHGLLRELLDHGPTPSLVHGDLWSGNVLGWRWLIDPAVHHADREVDLAMLELFGGLHPGFLAGYTEVAPLPDGADQRRLAYQLVPLLVHVRLFGASYLAGIRTRLDALGW